jgi:2-aminoadipate transaminase
MRKPLENPEIVSLAAGFVDQESLPNDEMKGILDELFSHPKAAKAALQYGSTIGHLPLRKIILDRLEADGINRDSHNLAADSVVVTNGSQQLLYLVTSVLVDPGDIVLVEDPTYFVYMGILDETGAFPVGVPADEGGLVPEGLARTLERLEREGNSDRVKMLYLMTYYANPTGRSLMEDRRARIMEVVGEFEKAHGRLVILEDAAYRYLAIDEVPPRPVKELDSENQRVIYAGTFSKALSPGLRLGFGVLPEEIMTCVLRQKGNQDFGTANFCQHLAERVLRSGAYDRHTEKLRQVYRDKRDRFLDAMRRHLPDSCRWDTPKGGLYCWMTVEGMETGPESPLFQAALERKVLYVPGEYCYCPETGVEKPKNAIRLCYGLPPNEDLEEGVRRLGESIRAANP